MSVVLNGAILNQATNEKKNASQDKCRILFCRVSNLNIKFKLSGLIYEDGLLDIN